MINTVQTTPLSFQANEMNISGLPEKQAEKLVQRYKDRIPGKESEVTVVVKSGEVTGKRTKLGKNGGTSLHANSFRKRGKPFDLFKAAEKVIGRLMGARKGRFR